MTCVDRNSQYGLTDDDLKRLGLVPNDKQYSLAYMLRRIKVHLEPDSAEAAFRPNEAMDDVIARVVALEALIAAREPNRPQGDVADGNL